MIQPEELQLNNYVKDQFGDIFKIGWIDPINDTCGNIEIGDISFDSLYPIELTPEILIRLGFVKEMIKDEYQEDLKASEGFRLGNTLVTLFRENDKSDCIDFLVVKRDTYINTVSYLHQLQNLIDWLAGQKLKLKEE